MTRAAAEGVKRVVLELGGKGPNLVFADLGAELATAVRRGVRHCFQNSGQSCNAPTRMLVERSVYAERWERIVFNLPQAPPLPGAKNQIQRHRTLLREFCASAASRLADDGQVWVTLLSGQGGTPLDPVQRRYGDTWQLQHEAARAGLLVSAVAVADLPALADLAVLRFNFRGVTSPRGTSEGAFGDGITEAEDLAAGIGVQLDRRKSREHFELEQRIFINIFWKSKSIKGIYINF